MPKIRKLRRKKKFKANVNRKRLRNKLTKLPNIECKQIKEAWEAERSTVKNLAEMGLAYDPNQVLKIPNVKREMLDAVKDNNSDNESDAENVEENGPKKLYVVQSLEKEARQPRAKLFRLPNNEVQFATYMMDKYGDDYRAMMRDHKNYNQLTYRQIKAKIERFKNIPEQYAEYLVQKGEIVLEDPTPMKKIKPQIEKEPIEKKPSSKLSRRKRKKSKLIESIWQEETIGDKSINDDGANKMIIVDGNEDEEITSSNQINREKKLHLFSDDEEESDFNDDLDDDFSDSEDGSDNKHKKTSKLNTNKASLKLSKNKSSKQKNKKFKVRM